MKNSVLFVHGKIARYSGCRESLPDFERTHPERSGTDWLSIRFQDPDLPGAEGAVEEMPIVLLLEVAGVGKVPAPQVNYDLPVLVEIGGDHRIFRQG